MLLTRELLLLEVLHVLENSTKAFHRLDAKLHVMSHFHKTHRQKVSDRVQDSNPQVRRCCHFEALIHLTPTP